MQATRSAHDSVVATLEEVSRLHAVRTDADAALFELAAVFADQHGGDAPPRSGPVLPGTERAVLVGGVGTPHIAEFACAELGARLQMSPWSARRLVADALDVRHRLPLVWAQVVARRARVSNARRVATTTRHLSLEAAAYVDAAMADHVDGSLPWGRFETRLAGKIVAADPALAAAREDAAAADQFARRTRSSEQGTAGFYVRSTVGVIARLDATIAFLADALVAFGDPDPEDLRRVKAVALLANPVRAVELLAAFAAPRADSVDAPLPAPDDCENAADEAAPVIETDAVDRMDAFARTIGFTPCRLPAWLTPPAPTSADPPDPPGHRPEFRFDWSRLLPSLTLYLHLSAHDLATGDGGVVRWEGEGPVTHAFVHQHLRPLHDYVIKPVIDLAHQAPVDAYELPDRLREAVRLLAPSDVFPFAARASQGLDVDHTLPYDTAGDAAGASRAERHWSTRLGNLGPLTRTHHRIKTHGAWTVRQPFPGIYLWRDPHGMLYLQDHTGTHPVGAPRVHDPDVDLYPTDVLIEADFGRQA